MGLEQRLFPRLLNFFCEVVAHHYKVITLNEPNDAVMPRDLTRAGKDMTQILMNILNSAIEDPQIVCYVLIVYIMGQKRLNSSILSIYIYIY